MGGSIMKVASAALLSVSALSLMATDVAAQSDAPLEEIMVTARKRTESFQDVPITVTAFSAQQIESAGIEKPRDFVNLTPNVTLVETQNQGNAFVVIRGISQARNSEPSVAVVIDGVQLTQPAQFNTELFDIESIQVLKGPQGALYGRNAIGGAIIVQTKDPTDEFEGHAKVGIDNGFGYKGQLGLSGPLAENLKFRASVSYVNTDGYIPNTYLHEDADPFEDLSGRLKLLWTPADNVSIDLRGSASRTDTQALYFNIVAEADDTSLPVRVNNAGMNLRHMYNVSLKTDIDYDYGTLTSVSSYDWLDEILTGDAFDFLPIDESYFKTAPPAFGGLGFDLNQSQYLSVETWSQELRFTSPAEKRFRYIVGGYFVGTTRYISTGNMVDLGQGVFPVYKTPSTNPANPQATFLADSQENFAWAVFGDFSYDLTDQLEASVSLRYDHDHRRNTTLTPPAFLPNVPGFPSSAFTGEVRGHSWDQLQPKFTLRYEPADNLTVYGSWSRGFRSGGFNQSGVGTVAMANGIVGVNDLFDKEVADTWELGAKGRVLDNLLDLGASVYRTTTEGSYFFVFLAANSTQNLGNIDKARHTGFELEAAVYPVEGLRLNASLGYDDSKITAFPDPAVIGNEAPLVSRYTYNMGAEYRSPLDSAGLELVTRIDYRRIGRTWWEPYNTTSRSPVDLVDLRLGVEAESWALTAWSKNLTDEKYNAEFSPGGFVFKAPPRRYGLDFSMNF